MPFKLDESRIKISLSVQQDDQPVRGNAMASGDGELDKQVEDEIIARLEDGDVWAWAQVEVSARYDGIPEIVESDYLGCCSYEDEASFRADGYYADIVETVRRGLIARLECIYFDLEGK